jgi:hypothetical protein
MYPALVFIACSAVSSLHCLMEIKARILDCPDSDEHIVRRLGKAVVVLWDSLPAPPDSTLNCPGGQTEVLVCVEFENKRVSEPAAGTQEATPSSASTILLSQFQAECEELFANNPAP